MKPTKCHICKKEMEYDEILYEIIVMREGKGFWQNLWRKIFVPEVDRFVCETCINKGITWQPQLKVLSDTFNRRQH